MLKIKYTLILVTLFMVSASFAENHVVTLSILSTPKTYEITPRLSFVTSDKIKEAIDNGIRIQIIAKAQLIKPRSWWFDDTIESQMIVLEVDYLSLGKLYIVRNKDTGEQLGFNGYDQIWKEFEKLMKFSISKRKNSSSAIKIRIMLDKGALPTAMQLPVLFDSQWDINTPWYKQMVNASE